LFSRLSAFLAATIVATSALALDAPGVDAAGTPAGTAIVNQATANYSDGAGNQFGSTSNLVSTTVQSAPSLSIVPGATQKTVPGGQLSDDFIVTNTGNGVATFVLTMPADSGSDAASATIVAYTLGGTYPGGAPNGCSTISTGLSCSSLANLNGALAGFPLAAGKSVAIGVVYNVATSASAGTASSPATIVTPLNGSATQSSANNAGATAATSTALATAPAETDDVLGDARLDLQKSSANTGTAGSPTLTYAIVGADGGYTAAHDLASVKTLLGSAAPGIFISDAIPQFAGAPLAVQSLAVTGTSAANGYAAGSTTLYYTSASTPTSGWTAYASGALPATVTYVGVLLSGGANGIELNPNNGTSSTGRVGAPAITLQIVVSAPSGAGSGNANAVANQADSAIGGGESNPTPDSAVANPLPFVLGPNVPATTSDTTTGSSVLTAPGTGLAYPTQPAGSTPTQPGASNSVGSSSTLSGIVFNGPSNNPTATGSYNGTAAVNTADDFTAIAYSPTGFTPTNTSATAIAGNALGSTYSGPSFYVAFGNTLQNQGNAADNIAVTATAPSGWTVAIFAAGANPASATPLSGAAASSATATFNAVPSGGASSTTNLVNYQVVYYPSAAATAFTTYDSVVTATSGNAAGVSNATHDETVIGGPLALSKTQTLDPTTCPGGSAVPGCTIKYAITYANNALPASQCPSTATTSFPAYDGGFFVKGITLVENGKAAPNTWGLSYTTASGATAYNTGGLNAPATDSFATTTFTGNTAASYAFSASIGGASGLILAPGCSGTVTFAVTVSAS
jgi:hypothetical protein